MAELKDRKDMDPAYTWDLSSLYRDDQAWEKDFAALDAAAAKVTAYRGKLKDAAAIRGLFDAETDLMRKVSNIYSYAARRHDEDTAADDAMALVAKAAAKYAEISAEVSFAEPEILSLPEETLRAVTKDPLLAPYKFTMQKILKQKPHVLSAENEQLLASLGEVLSNPAMTASALQDTDLKFDSVRDSRGNEVSVSESNYILLQQSQDRTLRENSFRSFYKGYREHINTFASTYSGAVKGAVAEAKARHYHSSRAMEMAEENIPEEVYDNLVSAVRRHLPSMYRYVALRKKILGISDLHYYDVYAPLTKGIDHTWTYGEAQKLVLEALAPLGKEYTDTVRKAFASRWIDVYPNKNKAGGAYSAGTYDSIPMILTNFTGDYSSVSTIAHEMGHSMHSWRSNNAQPPQYADYTLFVAEVASTVNENLLAEDLLKKTQDPAERLFLLNQYLDGFKGTVYRQTMFAEFEQQAHRLAEQGGALTPAALNGIYAKLVQDYFGPELVMDDEVQYEWARIPHFYRPFYVYKYATSYSAAVAIEEKILKEGDAAVKPYLEFLSMGGSDYPLDELAHAGVDMRTPEPIDLALQKFDRILDEAEKLADEIGG
ncbi:MAG: oligoendopeptidase F [Lachnospiraceae bacterium]|jgi:oligoendopeptidase F